MMRSFARCLFGCVLLFHSSSTSTATEVLDQFSVVNRTGGASLVPGLPIGQTFIAGQNGLLSTVSLQLNRSDATEGALLTIYNAENDTPTTTIGSVPIPFSDIPNSNDRVTRTYAEVDVSSLGIDVSAGQELALVVTYDGEGSPFWVNSDNPAAYENGRAMSLTTQHGWLPILIPRDQGFRTFVVIPEPSSVFLLTTSLMIGLTSSRIRIH